MPRCVPAHGRGVSAAAGPTDSPGNGFHAPGMSAQRAGWDARSSWHTCAELCEHSGGTSHPQVPARRSAGLSHPALGLSCSCPVSPGQSPACAGGSLAAFSPFLRALPERLRSQEGARAPSWSCASPAATQGAPPPPPALASSVHSRAPLPPGCSRGRGRHSWAGSDSSAQLEGAQLRTRMEGGPSGSGERRLGGQREPPARTRTGQRCCHKRKLLICWE